MSAVSASSSSSAPASALAPVDASAASASSCAELASVHSASPTLSPAAPDAPWLLLIDMQEAFASGSSPWGLHCFRDAMPAVLALIESHAPRVVATRFVPPAGEAPGAWAAYYVRNRFAIAPEAAPLWELVPEVADALRRLVPGGAQILSAHTFGKWNAEMDAAIGGARSVVIAGVSTDCCVLNTALAAADAGCYVRVAADACAATTPLAHNRALDVLEEFTPLISVTGRTNK